MRAARDDLGGQRVAVVWRPTLHHVGDVDLFALQTDAAEQLGEQPARLADERLSLTILVEPRPLADEHQVGGRIAHTEDHLGSTFAKPAIPAFPERIGLCG